MTRNFHHYRLIDLARRHDLKLLGHGRVSKRNLARYEWLICVAAHRLRSQALGAVIIVEGSLADSFVVVRSLEVRPPRRCAKCENLAASHLILADDLRHVTK